MLQNYYFRLNTVFEFQPLNDMMKNPLFNYATAILV